MTKCIIKFVVSILIKRLSFSVSWTSSSIAPTALPTTGAISQTKLNSDKRNYRSTPLSLSISLKNLKHQNKIKYNR